MNETTEQVRDTFHDVADEVPVPPFDEVAFRRTVRTDRRRRRTAWVGGVAVAASLTGAAAYGVSSLLPDG